MTLSEIKNHLKNTQKIGFQLPDGSLVPPHFHVTEKILGIGDLEIEVEYQGATIGKYGLDFDGTHFLLMNTHTDCLAKDTCGIPEEKQQVALSAIETPASSCDPSSGCC